MADGAIKNWLTQNMRISKEQQEPVLAGTEYRVTKQVTQAYKEAIDYSNQRVKEYEEQAAEFDPAAHYCRVVGPGCKLKGYNLVIPIHDDYDLTKEFEAAIRSLKETFSLQDYLDNPDMHGKIKLYPYEIEELSIIFPEFQAYNLVKELEEMKKRMEASYGQQIYSKTVEHFKQTIEWEVNQAMIKGNEEIALRMKESDTTLMLSLTAGQESENRAPARIPRIEPTRKEIEAGLKERALKDLEINAPSEIDNRPPEKDTSVALDTVNVPRRVRKKKVRNRTRDKPAEKEKASA